MENEMCDCSNDIIQLTVEELADRWTFLLWECGVERLRIEERFNNVHSFTVHGLSMEIEDDSAYCSDYKGTLKIQLSVLIAFLKKDVRSISLLPLGNNLYQEKLSFDDGEVLIEIDR